MKKQLLLISAFAVTQSLPAWGQVSTSDTSRRWELYTSLAAHQNNSRFGKGALPWTTHYFSGLGVRYRFNRFTVVGEATYYVDILPDMDFSNFYATWGTSIQSEYHLGLSEQISWHRIVPYAVIALNSIRTKTEYETSEYAGRSSIFYKEVYNDHGFGPSFWLGMNFIISKRLSIGLEAREKFYYLHRVNHTIFSESDTGPELTVEGDKWLLDRVDEYRITFGVRF